MQRSRIARAQRPSSLAIAAALVWGIAACSVAGTNTGPATRSAQDLPERFVVDSLALRSSQAAPGRPGCLVHLVDPRDGTRLRLMRSQHAESQKVRQRGDTTVTTTHYGDYRGDYAVEAEGRYGVAKNEWLRIDCVSGRALGIIEGR